MYGARLVSTAAVIADRMPSLGKSKLSGRIDYLPLRLLGSVPRSSFAACFAQMGRHCRSYVRAFNVYDDELHACMHATNGCVLCQWYRASDLKCRPPQSSSRCVVAVVRRLVGSVRETYAACVVDVTGVRSRVHSVTLTVVARQRSRGTSSVRKF